MEIVAVPQTIGEVEEALFAAFPRAWAEGWDRVGLAVGDPDAPVARVALALDATPSSVRAAQAAGADVLVTHHPVCLEMLTSIRPDSCGAPLASATIWEAATCGVALVAMHTNLDRSPRATARLPRMLGLEPLVCGIELGRGAGSGALGSVAELACCTSLDALALHCRATFGRVAQVFGVGEAPVRRAAFFTGSLGGNGADALAADADVVVCGECGYHRALDLVARGCQVIILGHDTSELPLVDVLTDRLEEAGFARDALVRVDGAPVWHSLTGK